MTNSFSRIDTNIGVNNLCGTDENDYLDFGKSKRKRKLRNDTKNQSH